MLEGDKNPTGDRSAGCFMYKLVLIIKGLQTTLQQYTGLKLFAPRSDVVEYLYLLMGRWKTSVIFFQEFLRKPGLH